MTKLKDKKIKPKKKLKKKFQKPPKIKPLKNPKKALNQVVCQANIKVNLFLS